MRLDRSQAGVIAVGAVAVALLAVVARVLVPHSADSGWHDTVGAANDLLQMTAIIVGGWWTYRLFVRQRNDFTRANVTHSLQHVDLGDELRLLHVIARIENVGNVPLEPPSAWATIQQVLPLSAEGRATLHKSPIPDGEHEVDWPVIGEQEIDLAGDGFVLEPGESDKYHMDFIIPAAVRVVQVHTMVYCGGDDDEQYWDATSLLDLTAQAGSVIEA
ncbi:MAG: hypothetical protein ACJ79K_09730 [Gemmatimonadaceae bacterium]